eukprot:TRINITY_DN19495_c0_g1_i1.p1 TRINITY_DN19495_c0_g1~~TRINITY_DN19495_c0_g1_i1.p1  ORF type:complete len:532 (-),score=132.17 TRINITY_DN19495_c0_g1_i1:17-1612(-)
MHRRKLPRVHSFAPSSERINARGAPYAHLSAALSVSSLSRSPSHGATARTPFQLPSLGPQNMVPGPFSAWDSAANMRQTFSEGFQNSQHVREGAKASGALGSPSRRLLFESGDGMMTKEQADAELAAAKSSGNIDRLKSSILLAQQHGVQRKKVGKADIVLKGLQVQQAIQAAREANDVETLRSAMRRAAHTEGMDDRFLKEARQHLEMLEAEEILRISMRNNVSDHLKKCIDIANSKGVRRDLVAEARALYERSMAERKLVAALQSGETKQIEAAIAEAQTNGTSEKEIEYAQSALTSLSAKQTENRAPEVQDDPVEQRLIVAINLRETGALLKAILLADKADKVAELEVELAAKNGVELPPPKTHEALIAEAQVLVAELEVQMHLPVAMRKRDRKKLRAVVEKAEACMKEHRVEFLDLSQARSLLALLDASESLREAMASKTKDAAKLEAAIQVARDAGVEIARIRKAEQALLEHQMRDRLHEATESNDPDQLSKAIYAAKSVLERREVEKAEQLLRNWSKRALVAVAA